MSWFAMVAYSSRFDLARLVVGYVVDEDRVGVRRDRQILFDVGLDLDVTVVAVEARVPRRALRGIRCQRSAVDIDVDEARAVVTAVERVRPVRDVRVVVGGQLKHGHVGTGTLSTRARVGGVVDAVGLRRRQPAAARAAAIAVERPVGRDRLELSQGLSDTGSRSSARRRVPLELSRARERSPATAAEPCWSARPRRARSTRGWRAPKPAWRWSRSSRPARCGSC